MSKLEQFEKKVLEKIRMKCEKIYLNPELIQFKMNKNLIILEIPTYYTYTDYVFFNGEKNNELKILLDIDDYLNEGIGKVFTRNIKISDDDYLELISTYEGMYEID